MADVKYLFLCKHDFPQYFFKFSDVVLQISESTHWSNANGDFNEQNLNNIIYLLTKNKISYLSICVHITFTFGQVYYILTDMTN